MTKSRPVLVALIGAVAIIVAAIIGYMATTGGLSGSTFEYTGEIRDTGGKPVADAKVRITEDEKVPQTVPSDSEGVFHANLLKKSANIYIEYLPMDSNRSSLTSNPNGLEWSR